ncbi:MAG: FtsX-like permease family protein [Bacillota bacterium]|nr:FtsX-like permease family protein [Bacillota bacterium]
MIKVSNRKCISRLSTKALKASRTRNFVAVSAIVLTTMLFASLFTILFSINEGYQESNFRQAGGYSHGTFKYLTEAQFEELKDDPTIKEWGCRRPLGTAEDAPFNKSDVELGYSSEKDAHWMYCDPTEGNLPDEGTDQAATDLRVLELLGVKPELGAEFTVDFYVDGIKTTQTFSLSGWWEYDEAITANHILLPESRVNQVLEELGVDPENSMDGLTGSWNLNMMFDSSLNIEKNMEQILSAHGYQSDTPSEKDTYIATGINWGYTGAQLTDSMDPGMAAAVDAMLVLIILTGYLIIYNVFRISVSRDIRFYGLLKTVGTTPGQIRRIIRRQALLLSAAGIPAGLLLGWLAGAALNPLIINRLDGIVSTVSAKPVIFIASAAFSLITVTVSCARPGRMAGAVSPIEAVRYTEGNTVKRKKRKTSQSGSLPAMAKANLGRSRSRTAITIISMSLAAVLLNITATFTQGFDMDKYLSNFVCSDFVVADAGYFNTGGGLFEKNRELPVETTDMLSSMDGVAEGGRVYGKTSFVDEFIEEQRFREIEGRCNDSESVDRLVELTEKNEKGLLETSAQIYGMDSFILGLLNVIDGDLSDLYDPSAKAIAAVYHTDDYGNPVMSSNWAKVGDTVTLRYVEEYEFFNPETGEVYEDGIPENELYQNRPLKYRDEEYKVAALVEVPSAVSYRYYGEDTFVLNDSMFIKDSGTDSVMLYAFNAEAGADKEIGEFLADYTEKVNLELDYESRETKQKEFESFRSMFMILGGALSVIVGMVGVLNYFNAVFTGITSRKREFAILRSVGMTGRQLKRMLIYEGLLYAAGSIVLALCICAAVTPLMAGSLDKVMWFFTFRFTIMPIIVLSPVFILLGCLIPLAVYRIESKSTIVERLREAEY